MNDKILDFNSSKLFQFLSLIILMIALGVIAEPVSANTDDTQPPLVYAVSAPPFTIASSTFNGYLPIKLSAKISDLSSGDSPIVHAEYYYFSPVCFPHPSTPSPMQASDGSFDEVVEDVEAFVIVPMDPTCGWDWVFLIVVGFDSEGNASQSSYITYMVAKSLPLPPPPIEQHPVIESISLVPSDGLVAAGDPIEITGAYTDANEWETHSAMWYWGDGSKTFQEDISSPVQASHVYSEAGIYPVSLTIWDSSGYHLRHSMTYESVIVYQPGEGFVAGGGWFNSPAGAYDPDPTLSGKAVFGFVSKYNRGNMVPDGKTKFQFKVADLDFHSSSYDWLVVTGNNYALFKGTGMINGTGEYKFKIWAGDDDPNTFRIKIWEEVDGLEFVIYDNGMDQAIEGGSIVIHTK